MTIVARGIICTLFVVIAGTIFIYPDETKVYIKDRYKAFVNEISQRESTKSFTESLPDAKQAEQSMQNLHIYFLGIALVVGGVSVAMNFASLILAFATILMLLNVVLHFPYSHLKVEVEGQERVLTIQQWRTFLFVVGVVAVMLMIAGIPPKKQTKRTGTDISRSSTKKPKPMK